MKTKQKSERNVSLLRLVRAMRHVKLPWKLVLIYIAVSLVTPLASIFAANAMGDLIDASGKVANVVLFSLVGLYVFYGVTSPLSSLISGVGEEQINLSLRGLLWKKLMRIPQHYYDQDGGETLVSRVTTDCDYAGSLLMEVLGLVSLIYSSVTYVVSLFSTNTQLALFTMIMVPLSILVGVAYSKCSYIVGQKVQGSLSEATNYLIERTRDLPLVKAANTARQETEQGTVYFQAQYKARLYSGFLSQFYMLIETAMRVGSVLLTFIVGASLVNQNVLTTGDVVAFYQISTTATISFANIVYSIGRVRRCVGSMSRVVTVMETESEDTKAGRELDVPNEDIRLDNVTFAYQDGAPVLQNLDCVIPKNKVTAVIGANGSGKTTLFKLLERLYTPGEGTLYFGDTPVEQFTLSSWRKSIGLVSQDRPILEGTLRSNITYGSDHPVSDEELASVAEMANLTELVASLPDGLDSYVAPGGRNFSGGQRQCIAIARAIVYNPDYLLLDEATSSLDGKSARAVTDALYSLMKGRTTVIIAHSLAAIRHADNVLVLKDGKVAASGAPADIIKTSEQYRQMVMNQTAPV